MSLLLLLAASGSPAPPVTTGMPVVQVREVADRLALAVTHADGSITRWAGDEADGALVSGNLEFGSAVPGGFKDLSCELLRGLTPRADEGLFDDVRCYGAGGRSAWEGRMAQLPRTNISLRPGAVGWSAHLDDDRSFSEIYIDRDLSRWGSPSVQRNINLVNANFGFGSFETMADASSGQPSLHMYCQQPWAVIGHPNTEVQYDSQGIPIGSVYYAWKRGPTLNNTDTNWSWAVFLSTDDVFSAFDSSGELRAVGPGSGTLTATATRVFARPGFSYGAVAVNTNPNQQYDLYWTVLAVYGNHGLTKQGAGSPTNPPGLLVTDMVADVVRRGAPLLNITSDSITTDSFVLTHFANIGPAAPSDWISRLNAYLLYEWAVWEDRTFRFRPRTDDIVWVARLSDGAQLDLEGDQAQDIYNGVVVTFQDPNGQTRTVGPPGTAVNVTDPSLLDTSPTNPVNAHGIPRRYAKLELSLVTTDLQAIQIGAIFLAEQNLAKRRGTLTVTGSQERQGQSGRWPAWMVRAGDYITVGDRAGEPNRYIIEARYSHATRTATLTLDSSAQKLDAILERLQAALVGVIS